MTESAASFAPGGDPATIRRTANVAGPWSLG